MKEMTSMELAVLRTLKKKTISHGTATWFKNREELSTLEKKSLVRKVRGTRGKLVYSLSLTGEQALDEFAMM